MVLGAIASALAQPQPAERVTFAEAVKRAVERNPSAAIAAAGILHAQGLLAQTRSAARFQVSGTASTTTLDRGVEFEGVTVTPRNAVLALIDARMPLYAPSLWARRTQAEDQVNLATLGAAETRRQTALAAADAYLTILARRRVVEANIRARDVARAHYDLASELERAGTGSRLNQLRAQQELSVDEGLVESARLALYQAQEALGVLLAVDGPVDAADEPAFEVPSDVADPTPLFRARTDIRLLLAEQAAAERVLDDTRFEYRPSFDVIFQPQTSYPGNFFAPLNTWRVMTQLTMPIFDGGRRGGQRVERQSAVDLARATLDGAMTSASSEVRAAREAVASAGRVLASTQAAASQAQEIVNIVNISFRAGAATNIEVIDAERSARDADTAVAVAEDALRRARLDLLTALGQFP